jgi:hypothetical protein
MKRESANPFAFSRWRHEAASPREVPRFYNEVICLSKIRADSADPLKKRKPTKETPKLTVLKMCGDLLRYR